MRQIPRFTERISSEVMYLALRKWRMSFGIFQNRVSDHGKCGFGLRRFGRKTPAASVGVLPCQP